MPPNGVGVTEANRKHVYGHATVATHCGLVSKYSIIEHEYSLTMQIPSDGSTLLFTPIYFAYSATITVFILSAVLLRRARIVTRKDTSMISIDEHFFCYVAIIKKQMAWKFTAYDGMCC